MKTAALVLVAAFAGAVLTVMAVVRHGWDKTWGASWR